MAIGLNDIKKSKNSVRETKKEISHLEDQKSLRPWEGYDDSGTRTRTIMAQEAIKKAQNIVRNNEMMVKELKNNFNQSPMAPLEESSHADITKSAEFNFQRPRNRTGIFGLLRDILEL